MRCRLRSIAAVGLAASLAACGGSATSVAPTAPVGTATPVAPTAPDATAPPASDAGPFPAGEPVDFMLLSDSAGGGVAELYAAKAAAALDREIRIRDHALAGWDADQLREAIALAWAEEVAGAELIVFSVHPTYVPESHQPCLEAIDWDHPEPPETQPPGWKPPTATTVADWQEYRAALDRVYDEIWNLRAGQPTIIRAYGTWLPWLGQWRQLGIESACVAGELAADQARREAAEAHGATFVSMADIFAGPQHDENPYETGWIAEDGMHLNEAGHVVLVDALAEAGFELSEPPR